MRSVQKFALMMCVIIVLATFGALALARVDGCTVCENGYFQLSSTEDLDEYSYTMVYCNKTGLKNDTKVTWYVNEIWECSNPKCNNRYTESRVQHSKIICNH